MGFALVVQVMLVHHSTLVLSFSPHIRLSTFRGTRKILR